MYMLGITNKETLINPDSLAINLTKTGEIELDNNNPKNLSPEKYLALAERSEAIAIKVEIKPPKNITNLPEFVNSFRQGSKYIHFAYIDPEDITKIYERPDIEKKPLHTNWENMLCDLEEFKGMEMQLISFCKD